MHVSENIQFNLPANTAMISQMLYMELRFHLLPNI